VLLPSSSVTAYFLELPALRDPYRSGREPANRIHDWQPQSCRKFMLRAAACGEPRRCLRWPSGCPGTLAEAELQLLGGSGTASL